MTFVPQTTSVVYAPYEWPSWRSWTNLSFPSGRGPSDSTRLPCLSRTRRLRPFESRIGVNGDAVDGVLEAHPPARRGQVVLDLQVAAIHVSRADDDVAVAGEVLACVTLASQFPPPPWEKIASGKGPFASG